jgi:hypothetical protein
MRLPPLLRSNTMPHGRDILIKKISNPHIDPDILLMTVHEEEDIAIIQAAVRNPSATREVLLMALSKADIFPVDGIFEHPNADAEMLMRSMELRSQNAWHVVRSPRADQDALAVALDEAFSWTRRRDDDDAFADMSKHVLKHPNCGPRTLAKYFSLSIERAIEKKDSLFQIAFKVAFGRFFAWNNNAVPPDHDRVDEQ